MIQLWRLLRLALKVAIFFTLFAFALNNQHDATVHFFFGTSWRGSMVLIVLLAFSAGIAIGVLGMVPRWWRKQKAPAALKPSASDTSGEAAAIQAPHGL